MTKSLLFRTFLIVVIGGLVAACANSPPHDASERTKSAKVGINPPVADTPRPYYDRGERIIWRDDFTGYDAGSFPRHMQLESGHLEVAKIGGRNYFRSVDGGVVTLLLPEALPQRFSIEIEYDSPQARGPFLFDTDADGQNVAGCTLGSYGHESFVDCRGDRKSVTAQLPGGGRIHPRFTVDGKHVSGYINEQLLPPLPDAEIPRARRVRLRVPGGTRDHPTLITVIHIAEGGRKRE